MEKGKYTLCSSVSENTKILIKFLFIKWMEYMSGIYTFLCYQAIFLQYTIQGPFSKQNKRRLTEIKNTKYVAWKDIITAELIKKGM